MDSGSDFSKVYTKFSRHIKGCREKVKVAGAA